MWQQVSTESHEMEPKDLVAAAYATFASGDTDAWTKLHTENLTFTIFGQLPQSGVFVGTDAVIEGAIGIPAALAWVYVNAY